jgi:ATP adenylyltransferase
MEYILSDQGGNSCIFCPGEDTEANKERLLLFMGPTTMVMMNRYPYNNGHLLVAPLRHISELGALSQEEALDLINLVNRSIGILKEVMAPEGFNVGLNIGKVAGAGIEEHLHYHIVPRWNGDTNFMTLFGDVRVIPEHIQQTYDNLLPGFRKIRP